MRHFLVWSHRASICKVCQPRPGAKCGTEILMEGQLNPAPLKGHESGPGEERFFSCCSMMLWRVTPAGHDEELDQSNLPTDNND